MWFTLAAYNAGQGHVKDARRLARQKGWNPNRWFNNVEKAMLLLSKRKYARQARHGYVRGREPVNYVRDIRDRFVAYQRLAE
jgi:membrane-bound lytic murein transglycosylase F